jgi:hypothetical protein
MPRIVKTIDPLERVIQFDNGTQLEVSPFAGTATQFTAQAVGLRSIELPGDRDTSPEFESALREIGAYEQETIHLDVTGPSGLRSYTESPQNDRIVLRPAIRQDVEPSVRVVLYQDESGGLSWHFAEGWLLSRTQQDTLRGRGLRMDPVTAPVFIIPTRTVAAQHAIEAGGGAPARLRGIITKWGRKVLKVLVIPVVSALLERPAQSIVGAIERKYRKDLIWQPTPTTYTLAPSEPFNEWSRLAGKRSLLLIHGIFSTVEGMLSELPRAAMEELHSHYDGRVIAYNHLSVMKSPEENAKYFLEQAKQHVPNGQLEFDILCHSRGGIVSRTLAERGKSLFADSNCRFSNVFFVASPNNGSVLGDAEHMVDMVDVFTNLLTVFPDGPVMYSIEILLGIIKLVAYTAETRLPGVSAMGTNDYIQKVLNRSNQASPGAYAGAASDYQPDPAVDNGFFIGRFGTAIMDRIFRDSVSDVANDLVVPEEGVYAGNGHPSFPLTDPVRFGPADHVWHSGFFQQSKTLDAIKRHFDFRTAFSARGDTSGSEDVPKPRTESKRSRTRGALRGPTLRGPAVRSTETLEFSRSGPKVGLPEHTIFLEESAPRRGTEDNAKASGSFESAKALQNRSIGGAQMPAFQARRDPAIEFREMMNEGEEDDLTVHLEDVAVTPTPTSIEIEFGPSESEIALSVVLKTPEFEVIGANYATMLVKPRRDAATEKVTFRLRANNPGPKPKSQWITAEFWKGNNQIGEVAHATTVVPSAYRGPATPDGRGTAVPIQVSSVRREDCDLSITLRGQEPKFDISFRCWAPGEEYPDKEVGTLKFKTADLPLYASQIIDTKFGTYPGPSLDEDTFNKCLKTWNADFIQYLQDFGKKLWVMLPEEFRCEYLRLRTVVRSIVVYSDELVFPWELVRPFETVGGKYQEYHFLGAAHVLGRWQPRRGLRPKQQRFRISGFAILRPHYAVNDLGWADNEVTTLKQLIVYAEDTRPVDQAAMLHLLARNDIQMVHFTGHGDYQANADLNALRLEDGPFPALSLIGTRLGQEAQPILYLNACSVGKTAPVAGQMGGFAASCLEGGWSGMIAPYWLINDERAAQFSQSLYAKLKVNRSIGEALQELRTEHADDPTYLAYSYIGDPWAQPVFS